MSESIGTAFDSVLDQITKATTEMTPDESAALVWLAFFAIPTWLHALGKGPHPKWFWTFTTIGLGLESYLHYQGTFDNTSIMLAIDGAGSAVATAKGWTERRSQDNSQ